GLGALMALLEERKRKLAAEGLFDEARKQLLPFLPETIGVITSPTGAVIRDILHRLADRFPRPVLIWPVRVQGEGSAEQVAAALRGFNALPESGPMRRPYLLIVARGGGSLEDLWSFNEEIVVRAAAESMIPLISAVGHETDVTLIDFAADRRAPTPTAAAEMAGPVRAALIAELMSKARRALAGPPRAQDRRRPAARPADRRTDGQGAPGAGLLAAGAGPPPHRVARRRARPAPRRCAARDPAPAAGRMRRAPATGAARQRAIAPGAVCADRRAAVAAAAAVPGRAAARAARRLRPSARRRPPGLSRGPGRAHHARPRPDRRPRRPRPPRGAGRDRHAHGQARRIASIAARAVLS